MSRAGDLPGVQQVTPGQVAASHDGPITEEDLPGLVRGLHAARALNEATVASEVTGPGEADSVQREDEARRHFWLITGRVPTMGEIAGVARADCVACAREGWPCESHRRQPGDPLALPPAGERRGCSACARLAWPCERHSGALGGQGVRFPAPYDLLNSVK